MTVLVIAGLCLLGVVPVLAALAGLLTDPGALLDVFGTGRIWKLWAGTMALGISTSLMCGLVGIPVAYALARRSGWLVAVVAALLPLPIVLPPWIAGIAWKELLPLGGFPGAVFLLTMSLWPIVALFALRGFRGAGQAVDAAIVARGRWGALRAIELPLAAPSILAGVLLCFVFAITDFGVVDFLSFYSAEPFVVLSSEIFQKWDRLDRTAEAAAVSLPTMIPSLIALAVILRIERRHSGTWHHSDPRPGAIWPGGAAGTVGLALVLGAMLLPLVVLGQWAARYDGALDKILEVRADALRSLGAAVGTGVVLAGLGVAAARASLRQGKFGEWLILALALIPLAAPGVMMAIGEILFWNHPYNPLSEAVYPSTWMLVLATSGRFCALGVLAARALLLRQDPGPSEAARLTGRPAWQRWLLIELPRMMPAVGLAAVLGFLLSMRELDVVVLIPAGSGTLTHRIFSMVHFARDELTATLCLLLVGLAIVPILAARLIGVTGVDCGSSSRRP